MWENKIINLGIIKEKDLKKFSFSFKGNLKEIVDYVKPCCGSCTYINAINTNSLEVTFKSSTIPYHLAHHSWEIERCINVYYKDGNSDKLNFKAKIVKK